MLFQIIFCVYAFLILKKVIVLLHTLAVYSRLLFRYKVTCLIQGNVCVQAEGIVKPIETAVLIQHHFERILQKK